MVVDRTKWIADLDSVKEVKERDKSLKNAKRKKRSYAVTDDDVRALKVAAEEKRGESVHIRLLTENHKYISKYVADTRHSRSALVNICIAFAARHDALKYVQMAKPRVVRKAEDVISAYEAGVHVTQREFASKYSPKTLDEVDLSVYYESLVDKEAEEELEALRRENDEP